MKIPHRIRIPFLLCFLPLTLWGQGEKTKGEGSQDLCAYETSKEKGMKELGDFTYSTSRVSRLKGSEESAHQNVIVPLFYNQQYKVVLERSGAPEGTQMVVYNRSPNEFGRRKLFSTEDKAPGKDLFVYMPPEDASRIYVQYEIPAGSSGTRGCVILILGYGSSG